MKNLQLWLSVFALAVASLFFVSGAQAQATRTWVSGVGDDVNPCSRTAPCKTFAGAISKTAAGGIINCIDPGGFGSVTITKSITIDCRQVLAGVLASATNGVVINAAAADVVTLRGLTIDGNPPAAPGLNGVRFLAGAALIIDECKISGFTSATGTGVDFSNSGNAQLSIINSVISNNGSASGGSGVIIRPTGTATAKVLIDNVQILNNSQGVRVDGTTGTGARRVEVMRSAISGNLFQGVAGVTNATVTNVLLSNNVISNNGSIGIQSSGAGSTIMIGNNVIAGNDTGINAAGGAQLISYQTNNNNLNTTANGTPTATQAPQ
ncbi:hypothetical protein MAUB1S_11541 [Mycolicibacterium aubagnense]